MLSAKNEVHPDHNIVFGSKKNFSDYSKGKITKEEYKKNRLLPILSIGKKSGDIMAIASSN